MTAQLVATSSGARSLKWGDAWLEDPEDPVAEAVASVRKEEIEGIDHVVLFGAGLGYRLLWLRELGVQSPIVFEPRPEVLQLAQQTLPMAFTSVRAFSSRVALMQHLRSCLGTEERLAMVAPKLYEQAFPKEHAALSECLRDARSFAQLRHNTIGQRLTDMVEGALGNLPQLVDVPLAHALGRPLEGCPAFLVAAGPSLDRNAHLLPEAAKRGAVFAVNTSAPVVAEQDIDIDVLVSIEALNVEDVLRKVAPRTRTLALDLIANASSFAAPVSSKVAFLSAAAGLQSVAESLSVPMLPYGASVATAAFRLAQLWGADPIVLLGQDLAMTEGRLYARGTGREHWRSEADGEVLHLHFDSALEDLFTEKGWKAPSRKHPRVQIEGWGGGLVDSTYDLCWFRRWFEEAAETLPKAQRCINATEGGARIAGVEEQSLSSVLDSLPPRKVSLQTDVAKAAKVSGTDMRAAKQQMREAAEHTAQLAGRCLKTKHVRPERAQKALKSAQAHSAVWAHAAPEMQRIETEKNASGSQINALRMRALQKSAERVASLLS